MRFPLLVLASVLSAVPGPGLAQVQASERATVSQTIDGTTITIDYSRPRIRGRGKPFGDVAKIGDHRWTPGANWASTITSNKAFKLNGHEVPEGTWSMWIDLEPDAWTMILDPTDSIFHTVPPEDSAEQIRFEVEHREGGPFFESMIFYVPETRLSGFDLRLGWGTTEIPFEVEVEPTFRTIVAEEEGRPLEGRYASLSPENEWPPSAFNVEWRDDRLHAHFMWEEPMDGWLLPLGAGFYSLGWVVDGELWEIFPGAMEVVRDGDRVVGFDARDDGDKLIERLRRLAEFEVPVPRSAGQALEGEYAYRVLAPASPEQQKPLPFTVVWADDRLNVATVRSDTGKSLDGWLHQVDAETYLLGQSHEGGLWEILPDRTLKVVRAGGTVIGFDVVGPEGERTAEIRRAGRR